MFFYHKDEKNKSTNVNFFKKLKKCFFELDKNLIIELSY